MREHVDAIMALIASLGYATFYVDVPTAAPYPYVLLWTSSGSRSAPALDDVQSDIDDTIGVTAVGETPDAVLAVQDRVRSVLAPGGLPGSLAVAGRAAWLTLTDSRTVQADRDVTIPGTNRHPAFGVDTYRLISTPA